MKETYRQVRTRFEPALQFEVRAVPFRAVETTELERLKSRLLRQLLQGNADPEQNALLRRAANEAAALAWLTPFPLLLFPTLLEEKARNGLIQSHRQTRVHKKSLNLLLEAA